MHLSERMTAAFVPAEGKPVVVLPLLESPNAKNTIRIDAEFVTWRDEDGPDGAFKEAIEKLNLNSASLGVEFQNMRVLEQSQIRKFAPDVRFEKLEETLGALRIIKDDAEIEALRKAIKLTEEILGQTIDSISPGMTEISIARNYQKFALEAGCSGMSFEPIVVGGPNGGSPHAHPGSREVRAGDLITIDAGVFLNSYPGDITRCVAIGELDPKLEEIFNVVHAANDAGRAVCKPGVAAQEVDRASRGVIENAGYGEYFIHRTGHGLGLEVHEPPYMMEGNSQPLEPGMTFTVEPGIYIPGLGGARVEDNMLITSEGAESLTQFPRELIRK